MSCTFSSKRPLAHIAIAFAAVVALMLVCVPSAMASEPVGIQKKGSAYYLVDDAGAIVKGKSSCKGMMRTAKLDGVTYYLSSKGKVEARVKGSTYYYDNGAKMTAADKADYRTLNKARKQAAKLVKASWSKAKKLKACFNWVKKKETIMHRKFHPTADWPSVNADDMFDTAGGDCQGYGAAMAYLAAAIGYSEAYVCNDCDGIKNEGHSWAEVNGKVYDGMFSKYNGVSYSSYFDRAYLHIKVPYYSNKHASKAEKKKASKTYKNGLYTIGKYRYCFKNGKKLKKTWKKVGSKTYYFDSKGRALTGSKKVKGTYYVFNLKGQLMKGKKTIVTVGSKLFGVDSKGRALKGWNSSKSRYYFTNGEVARGLVKIGSLIQWFDKSTGAYKATESSQLRSLLAEGADASAALGLLGAADKHETSAICDLEYPDAVAHMYTYGKVVITTRVNEPGDVEQIWTVSAA